MDTIKAITLLYSFVGITNIIAYIPQILSLIKSECVDGHSLKTWGIWTVSTFITFAYALLVTHDILFQLVAFSSFLGTSSITGLILYKKSLYNKKSVPEII